MLYAASDPGVTGGWAVINDQADLVESAPFSSWKNIHSILKDLNSHDKLCFALEHVHAMPKQGVSSTFSFGANYGGWQALLEILELSYILVTPQKWQKAILGSFPKGESKKRAFEYLTRRYPATKFLKGDHGVVDALCIALYLRKEKTGLL